MLGAISHEFLTGLAKDLKLKKDKVAFILEHFPEARNNDNILCTLYWKIIDGVQAVDDIMGATSPEVIRRARQKLQNEDKQYLPTDESIIKRRKTRAQATKREIHLV